MRYIIIVILGLAFLIFGCPSFLAEDGCLLARMVSYHFFHANIFHLLANCLSVWLVFRKIRVSDLIMAFLIASLTYLVATRPLVGFSNILFAIAGLRVSPKFFSFKNRFFVTFIAVNGVMFCLPQLSALTHMLSFVVGFGWASLIRHIKSLDNDYRRASK